MTAIELTNRQNTIMNIVRHKGPITGREIAAELSLSRAALRSDLAILTMAGLLGARPRVGYYVTGKNPSDVIAGMLGSIKVGEVLSGPVVVREHVTISNAIVTMFLEDVGTLSVVSEGGFLEGVASRKDMLKAAIGGEDIHKMPVGMIMTRMPNIIVTYLDEPVGNAAAKLIHHQVDSLPVVKPVKTDGHSKLLVVGRFTKTNITKLFMSLVNNE